MKTSGTQTSGAKKSHTQETHQVLYRKYRPHTFDDVIGQDHVVSTLASSATSGSIAHAYLFAGSRGIGKTSIARIFARAIGTTPNDLYEIDAASNRGIDDVRALREGVSALPFESKYKVYIIDEVHMLTKEAFNALLKTLEEPPLYVVFILATTEVHKLPETIVSRCQVFEFRRPSVEILKDTVISVAQKEGYTIDEGGAELVALIGDGSFRDTLGTLERVISGLEGNGQKKTQKIEREVIEKITGSPSRILVQDFVVALGMRDGARAFSVLNSLKETAFDPRVFLHLVVSCVRIVLLIKIGGETVVSGHASADDIAFARGILGKSDVSIDGNVLKALLGTFSYISISPIKELPLELVVLDLVEKKV